MVLVFVSLLIKIIERNKIDKKKRKQMNRLTDKYEFTYKLLGRFIVIFPR